MQSRGNYTVHGVSPSFGSQPSHDILPVQLLVLEGHYVAVYVSPFLAGIR